MKLKETRLASTNHQSVIADIKSLFADWNEGRQTLRLDSECNVLPFEESEDGLIQVGESPSGYRIDIVPIPDRELEKPEYNEEGELTKQAVMAGELRFNLVHPDFVQMPNFETLVNPANPDSSIV